MFFKKKHYSFLGGSKINKSTSFPDLPNAKSYPLDHPRDLVLNPLLPPPPTHELGMKMKIVVSDF